MERSKRLFILLLILLFVVVACSDDDGETVAVQATATLIPPPGSIPDPTATPFITRTPLPSPTPTFTNTPIPSETPPPSMTPTPVPIVGIIQSRERVNIRTGPGVEFSALYALTPGTGVEVLQTNPDGDWYNIEWEDEEDGFVQGWVFSNLLFIQDPPTPVPTFTLTPDLTALALGTGTPIGGGTVTATPPRSAVTATPIGTLAEGEQIAAVATQTPSGPSIPTLDLSSIDRTATALAGGVSVQPSPQPATTTLTGPPTSTPNSIGVATSDPSEPTETIEPGESSAATPTSRPPSGSATVQQGADIFAMCNNPNFSIDPPDDLAAGSTAEVYWAWYMSGPEFEQQHLNAVNYEVRINGRLLENWRQYGQRVVQVGNSYAKYWYVPVGTLESGEYTVTYRATWSQQITDGWDVFGPGTRNAVEEGSCNFTVQ